MMRYPITTGAVLAIAIVAWGCGDSLSPGGPVSGSWRSDTSLSTYKVPLDVRLMQRDTVIEGRGTYGGAVTKQVAVIGFYSSTNTTTPVILTFSAVNTIPAILFGSLSADGDTLRGEYQWGFNTRPPDTMVFVRY